MKQAIVIENVTKRFGDKIAVNDLTLAVETGGLYGFIGPNGAGKSTTIRMIMSIIFPDSGRLSVLDKASAVESKDQIGYLPEERGLYRKMKVGAFLVHMGKLKGMDGGPTLTRKVKDWLERVGLAPEFGKKCEELSKGMQQKVQFIACVLHEPELLILDEPFSGLDPVNMRLMRELFLDQHKRGATIIFSTHHMAAAEELCDHIIMIHQGRKMLDATLDEIRSAHEVRRIIIDPLERATALAIARAIPGVDEVDEVGNGNGLLELEIAEGEDPAAVLRAAAAALPARRLELKRPTLEDIFIDVVTGTVGQSEEEVRASLETGKAMVGAAR